MILELVLVKKFELVEEPVLDLVDDIDVVDVVYVDDVEVLGAEAVGVALTSKEYELISAVLFAETLKK